jgi:hypothetical protein
MINRFKIHLDNDAPGGGAVATEQNGADNNTDTVEVISEINLDAMVEPEGSQVINENAQYGKLKNIDEQIDKEKTDPAAVIKTEDIKSDPAATTQTTTDTTKTTTLPEYITKPFEDLRVKLGIDAKDFKMPEGLTKENYFEKLTDAIYENTDFGDQQFHPELAKINDLINKGIPFEKAISEYSKFNDINNLQPKELVELSLKQNYGKSESNPNGWDDEKIKTTLEKMEQSGYLDIEAEKIKSNHNSQQKTIAENLSKQHLDQVNKDKEKVNAVRQEQVQKSLDYLNTLTDVYGVPLSKQEINEFKDDFKYLTSPDETGVAPLVKLLQSNENLV